MSERWEPTAKETSSRRKRGHSGLEGGRSALDRCQWLRRDARAANPGTAGLSAINSAIEGLVKPLAVELRPRRVNAVSPGVIDTPWWNWMPEDQKRETFNKFAAATPAGRVGRPEDIAEAIVFLIGNSFMTGCVLECDGGLRLVGQSL